MTSGGAAFARGGGAGWLGAHVVTDAGHDVAEVVQVLAGQGVEQQAPEGTHVFQLYFGALDEADEALDETARFFKRHLS